MTARFVGRIMKVGTSQEHSPAHQSLMRCIQVLARHQIVALSQSLVQIVQKVADRFSAHVAPSALDHHHDFVINHVQISDHDLVDVEVDVSSQ